MASMGGTALASFDGLGEEPTGIVLTSTPAVGTE
jgi:hypothetical protein